ncbi:MAG TPA: LPS assembly lipoprotein LptE, partial [Chitinophagaceae bacterium]|nr:LPS assembly lipoprotein LptE [Chitinophagaceae bacterium]
STMPANKKIFFLPLICAFCVIAFMNSNCKVSYGLHDVSIPDSIKTVKINFIENKARYVNPRLSPTLTDRLRQKIVGQTRLTQTNSDNADWEISGYVSDYSVSTSGISQQQSSINRLNVSVHITLFNRKGSDQKEFDVSHPFDFPANKTLQAAESDLSDQIIRDMTDEIFNHIFSDW